MKTKKIDIPFCEAMARYQEVNITASLVPGHDDIELVVHCDANEDFVVFTIVKALRALDIDLLNVAIADSMII